MTQPLPTTHRQGPRRISVRLLAAGLALVVGLAGGAPVAAVDDPVVLGAVAWLATQQQPDGGFEVAGFPGFETADAALALAEAAQTDETWSEAEALAGVQAVQTGGNDALDALDDLVDMSADPAQAAKLVTLVVAPLGLDATDFDPSGDSATAVDLRDRILDAAGPARDYAGLAFNGRLFVVLALGLLGDPVPAALVTAIEDAQQPNGSWNFSGTPTGTDVDPDTTGLALNALVSAGRASDDPVVLGGLRALALAQARSGAWVAFGSEDPNSTALAVQGITAASGDPDSPCWRDAAVPALAGVPYAEPVAWLRSQQAPDGHITSPNDGFGVNTFATSQAVQGIVHRWVPGGSGSIECPDVFYFRRYINAAYFDILGRPADTPGANALIAHLGEDGYVSLVPRMLTGSAEYRRHVVDGWFRTWLGRPADAGAQATFAAQLRAGRRLDAISFILGSNEYFTGNGATNPTLVDALYLDVLGRPADAAGKAGFVAQLDAGRSRTSVARAIVGSSEARTANVKALFAYYLRRPADSGGLAYWTDRLRTGTSIEAVIVGLVSSDEYVGLTLEDR